MESIWSNEKTVFEAREIVKSFFKIDSCRKNAFRFSNLSKTRKIRVDLQFKKGAKKKDLGVQKKSETKTTRNGQLAKFRADI